MPVTFGDAMTMAKNITNFLYHGSMLFRIKDSPVQMDESVPRYETWYC